ncbi:ATP-binding protein [Zoogloea sp.]|uniref:ATP-binding protein n=1 Tax=Zoogloea sp. TaxID=49181 RepID=UPI0035B14657
MDIQPFPLPDSLFPVANALSSAVALYRDGRILFANRAMSRLSGYTPAELAAMHITDLFPPHLRDGLKAQSHAHLEGDPPPLLAESFIVTKRGEERCVELTLTHERIRDVRTLVCSLVDITERKHAENALLRMRTDLEAKVAQRTRDLQDAKATLEQDIARRETAETELLKRYAELTELNCRLYDTQQQLVQSEKMASIGQLAAGVAHEINNPIGYVNSNIHSLKGYVAQLLDVLDAYETAETALPADVREAVEAAKQRADFAFLREDIAQLISESEEGTARVRKIVQDLRDFSRTDASQDWQPADLHQGLDSTLNIASNEIKYRAEVVREYGTLPLVECLPSQLNQVFMNIFVNAAQSMPEGRRGTIRIRTGCEGDTVWIEVSDNGCGIPADVLDRIFDPFFTTKPVGKGTGLGLSLSYGIVQKHNGRIAVNSTPGAGTTFRITLPVSHRAEPGAPS